MEFYRERYRALYRYATKGVWELLWCRVCSKLRRMNGQFGTGLTRLVCRWRTKRMWKNSTSTVISWFFWILLKICEIIEQREAPPQNSRHFVTDSLAFNLLTLLSSRSILLQLAFFQNFLFLSYSSLRKMLIILELQNSL